ncbi:MAG: metalloregulator ArsR/SmtB family transcription factor [Ghiorsea sp.]
MQLLPLFKGLSDPIRLRIFHLLSQKNELCVCHLTDALNLPQSTVSRHLNTLKHSNLVESERRGKWVYYRLQSTYAPTLTISDMVKELGCTDAQLLKDLENLSDINC